MTAAQTVVIVEGASDRIALETLAQRRGRNLTLEGVAIVPIGGAHAIRRYLEKLHTQGSGVKLAGLVDARQEGDFRQALEDAGFGRSLTRAGMEQIGFYVCENDLEDELIRAVGIERVESVIEAQGELRSLRSLQKQPAQRGRTTLQHVRRFMSSKAGRKALYARLLVEALDMSAVPRPLAGLLDHV